LEETIFDEDQEDLPYDGELGSPYFNQTGSSEGNMSSDGRCTVHASPDLLELLPEDANTKQDNFLEAAKPSEVAPPCPIPADINQLLLRHFSQEELLRSGRLIEAETLPEVSLLESVDDTLFSLAPTHNSAVIHSNPTDSCDEKSKTASKNASLKKETEREIDNFTSAAADKDKSSSASTDSNQCSGDISYGQGQVHYPPPDFSKVAPKVKIPKAPSGPARSAPQCPSTMHRAQSSPGMLDVISRVLEDSVQPSERPYVFKEDDKQTSPALVHHLQHRRTANGKNSLYLTFTSGPNKDFFFPKDEHRALEMQNYMGLSRNTGTFDPNRLTRSQHSTCVTVSVSGLRIHSHVRIFVHVCVVVCAD
uniref:Uncharacterized protein n=1 Tax=Stegastes partitus TaxID=144197 RepID=A0A3B5BI85_9TELE